MFLALKMTIKFLRVKGLELALGWQFPLIYPDYLESLSLRLVILFRIIFVTHDVQGHL